MITNTSLKLALRILICLFGYISYATGTSSINSQICTIESKIDGIEIVASEQESIVDTIIIDLVSIESTIDIINAQSGNMLESVCTIESSIDELEVRLQTIESSIDCIDETYNTITSKIDSIDHVINQSIASKLEVIESLVDISQLYVQTIESSLDHITTLTASIMQFTSQSITLESTWCSMDSSVDTIFSAIDSSLLQINTIESFIQSIESNIDSTVIQSVDVESIIDTLHAAIQADTSLVRTIQSKMCLIESKVENLNEAIHEINIALESSRDQAVDRSQDFQATWTILEALQDALNEDQSNTDVVISKVDEVSFVFDESTTLTVIEALKKVTCATESYVDSLQDTMNIIQSVDYEATFTILQDVIDKLDTASSLLDEVIITVTILDPVTQCLGTPITQADVGTTGYTISTSGKYYLAENITFNPGAAATAITISAQYVTVDLNGKTLKQGNATGGVNSINVNSGSNVTIQNGFIQDFTNHAIVTINAYRLIVKDIFIDNSPWGVRLQQFSNDAVIKRVQVSNASQFAFVTDYTPNVLLEDCAAIDCAQGVLYQGRSADAFLSRRFNFRRCKFIGGSSGEGLRGGNLQKGQLYIDQCIFINKRIPILFNGGGMANRTTVIQDCIFMDNTSTCIVTDGSAYYNTVIRNNLFMRNAGWGVDLPSAMPNTVVLNNTFIQNASGNVRVTSGNHSILGNIAFHSGGDASNYSIGGGGTTIPKIVVSQKSAFPSPTPTFWYNISLTP